MDDFQDGCGSVALSWFFLDRMFVLGWSSFSDSESKGHKAGLAIREKCSGEGTEKPPALSINPMLYLSGNYGELAAEPRRALPRVIPTTFLNVMFVVLGRSWDSSVVSLSHSLLPSIVAILYSYQSPALLNGEPKLLHFPLIWWMTFGMRWWLEGAMRGKFTLSKPRFP